MLATSLLYMTYHMSPECFRAVRNTELKRSLVPTAAMHCLWVPFEELFKAEGADLEPSWV
jgi:hypothetical protein